MVTAVTVMILFQVASFFMAFGGNAFGPRYLAPALPFIGLAAAYGIKRWPEPGLVLLVVSIVLMLGVTAIAIDPPADVLAPLESFYLIRLREQRFAENLGSLIGAPPGLSLVVPLLFPIAAARSWLRRA
jgi:hypothetical protein